MQGKGCLLLLQYFNNFENPFFIKGISVVFIDKFDHTIRTSDEHRPIIFVIWNVSLEQELTGWLLVVCRKKNVRLGISTRPALPICLFVGILTCMMIYSVCTPIFNFPYINSSWTDHDKAHLSRPKISFSTISHLVTQLNINITNDMKPNIKFLEFLKNLNLTISTPIFKTLS